MGTKGRLGAEPSVFFFPTDREDDGFIFGNKTDVCVLHDVFAWQGPRFGGGRGPGIAGVLRDGNAGRRSFGLAGIHPGLGLTLTRPMCPLHSYFFARIW